MLFVGIADVHDEEVWEGNVPLGIVVAHEVVVVASGLRVVVRVVVDEFVAIDDDGGVGDVTGIVVLIEDGGHGRRHAESWGWTPHFC